MKIINYIVVVALFILFSFTSNGQNKTIDSLKTVLQNQKEDTNRIKTLSALGSTYLATGDAYLNQNNYPEAIKNFYSSLKIWEEIGDKKNIAGCNVLLAKVCIFQGNYSEALKNISVALEHYKALNDKKNIAECYQAFGVLYSEQVNYSEALKNYLAALKIREDIGDRTGIAQTYFTIGRIYRAQGDYSKALENYLAALKIFGEPHQPNWGLPMTYMGIGELCEEQGELANNQGDKKMAVNKFTEARRNYLLAFKEYEKNLPEIPIYSYVSLGKIAIKLNDFSEAKNYLEKGWQLSKSFEDKRDCLLSLSTLDSTQGNYKQAYEHYKMYTVYVDSLLKEENKRSSLRAKGQYDFDKKEAVAKAEQDKKDTEAKRVKNIQYFTIAILAIVVLAILIIALIQYRNNKQKRKANILLWQQKEKVENALSELKSTQAQLIQSEKMASLGELTAGIAHEIQNPLNFVNNFSEVNGELIDELKGERRKAEGERDEILEDEIINDIQQNLEKINHHGKRADAIVKGMLEHSKQTTGVRELTDINALSDEYLRLAYHGMRAKDKNFNVEMKTDFDNSVGKINIVRQDIGRVLLNIINNAFYAVNEKSRQSTVNSQQPDLIKYEPAVSVSTKKINDKVEIKVSDNGKGIPQNIIDKIFQPFFTTKPTGSGTGLGLSLSYDIIKADGGEIKVETKEGEGSEFLIQLPIV